MIDKDTKLMSDDLNNENSNNYDNSPSTYLCIGNKNDGQIEIDLVQFRERNVSMR